MGSRGATVGFSNNILPNYERTNIQAYRNNGDVFVTLNDSADSDAGPNGLENIPVVSVAFLSGPNLILTRWSTPRTMIEVFFTDMNEGSAIPGDNQLELN